MSVTGSIPGGAPAAPNEPPPGRVLLLDCWISDTDMTAALGAVRSRIAEKKGGYVCFSNVHSVVSARKDLELRAATNQAFMAMPDGRPLSVVGRLKGHRGMGQVPGPDFMPALMEADRELRHYFYGSTPDTLDLLVRGLTARIPGIRIVGTYSPPFRPLSPEEEQSVIDKLRRAEADIIWVGLGAPKQERWMARHWEQLKPAVLMGVGAAFDFHSGRVRRAPPWVRRAGLEWLFRLASEPRRLFRRYFVTNSLFIYYMLRQLIAGR